MSIIPVPAQPAVRSAAGLRNRAVRLLEAFFERTSERERRLVFGQAFDGLPTNPARHVDFPGAVAVFAAHAVDQLLAFGCAARGKHCLSLLLETMASIRGRQTDPDYYELPALLDAKCSLPTREEERRYLDRLIQEIETKARLYSPLSAVARTRSNKPILSRLGPWTDDAAIDLLIRHRRRKSDDTEEEKPLDFSDILDAFGKVRQAVLLGAPGSGKSTTLRKLALNLGQRAEEDPQAPVPLLASLGNWLGDRPLSQFLMEEAPEIGWAVEALSKSGRLALLLDGLNEVPTGKRRDKSAEVKKLCQKLEKLNPTIAIVASCRREDYTGDLDLGLDTLTLEPLPPQRIRGALRQWVTDRGESPESAERLFWQLAGDERLSKVLETWLHAGASENAFWSVSDPRQEERAYKKTSGQEDQFWKDHVPNPRSLLRLAANPFMLTMLFQVWLFEGQLPMNRGDLFGRFVDRLMSREGLLVQNAETTEWHPTGDGERLIAGLADLAWNMQTDRTAAGEGESADFGVLTVVSRSETTEALSSESLVKQALDATLLEGTDQLRFRHQLLQEYFTAKALQARIDQTGAEELWPAERWWERTGWEETAVLLAGFYADDCSKIIRWLAQAQPEVAAECILESGADIKDEPVLLRELQADWLPRLTSLQREPAPEARAAIGRALGQLGLDNRKGVGLRPDGLPDIDWVEILGGPFLYQGGERREIETFWIARYPITNAQYQPFLEANDGYADDRWWKGLSKPQRVPARGRWSESNHPRESVSWFEAMAFCAWLSHKLGLDISLPTEWQWERAARGREGRAYPWGNEYLAGYANIHEAGRHYLARTSAVGIYPQGASLEGVLDLSGNVWEWCLNEYEKADRIQKGGEESRRVLRGGSWLLNLGLARADLRNLYLPRRRLSSIGFRVVVSSPIVR